MNTRLSPSRITFSIATLALILTAYALFCSLEAKAQDPPASPAPEPHQQQTANQNPPANSGTTLRLKVNLVPVPVVVRDSAGHAVGNLQKENFQLFDDRKQQQITQFTLEESERPGTGPTAIATAGTAKHFVIPRTFTALLFDDVHSNFENLPQLQAAALRFISIALARAERLGIFTTSGKVTVDFTDDRTKLEDAVRRLKPNSLPGTQPSSCPSMTYYAANQIVNRHDMAARGEALAEVSGMCGVKDPKVAEELVTQASERVLRMGDMQTALVLKTLSDVVNRLSSLPGQRNIILASPSFLVSDREHREYQVVDRAVRAHVVISALDTRGVYTDENDQIADSNVLSEFTDATGGTFFHNNNDLTEGLYRIASPPEFVYQLGFSPQDLQENGKYHQLSVKIVGVNKLSVSARRGYFAPNHLADPKQIETTELDDALYSQAEIHDLPIQIQTQTIHGDKPTTKLNVLTLVDLDALPHRQADGKNTNELRIVAAIFDRNGKYLGAINRKVAVHWSDDDAGVQTATTFSFLLDPGPYLVRMVVRDSESQHLSAQAAIVEIP
ncbi:MAG TPA: VWA domain-containing protein [Methylomirabilota bacterium]|nr:VWA domain-containing protein [Methylomirabilota bacterium]